jgi:hypothetical protein
MVPCRYLNTSRYSTLVAQTLCPVANTNALWGSGPSLAGIETLTALATEPVLLEWRHNWATHRWLSGQGRFMEL